MIASLIAFELRRRIKVLSTYVYAAVLFLGALLLVLADGGVFSQVAVATGSERVMVNSPYALFSHIGMLSLFGLLMVAAVFGQAAYQDFGHGTWVIIFTKKVRKGPYLLGRFAGALLYSAVLFLAIAAGAAVGVGGVLISNPSMIGEHRVLAYLWPYFAVVWPMLFGMGAMFFSLAALTRRMAPVYVGMVVTVLGYLVLTSIVEDVEYLKLGALLDPFGMLTFFVETRYWTPAERNSNLVPLAGTLLWNRLLWLAVGSGLLALSVARFRTTVEELNKGRRAEEEERPAAQAPLPRVRATPTPLYWVGTALSSGWLSFRDVLRSPVYWSFITGGLALTLAGALLSDQIFGTSTWPVTYLALELVQEQFEIFVLITLTFYAGELVWKERDAELQDIIDATRAPTWVGFTSKLTALALLALSLQLVSGASALLFQLSRGFLDVEWRLYAIELFVFGLLESLSLCVLALVAQVLVNQKYLGHAVMIVYFISRVAMRLLGVEDYLLRYGTAPRLPYSDMNGYGHFVYRWGWYSAYWSALALVLALVGYALFVRGRETAWRQRLAQARARATGGWRVATALGLAVFAAVGGFIFYHTHVLNPYITAKDRERNQARYEQEYKSFASLPMPRITDADVTFHLYPSQRRLEALGVYRVKNKTPSPIRQVLLQVAADARVRRLGLAGVEQAAKQDKELGLFLFELPTPLEPAAEADLTFDLEFVSQRLQHGQPRTEIVENGTFFNNFDLPMLGYQEDRELTEDGLRKKYGLPSKERMADRDDEAARQNSYIRMDSDFITFKATVSTEPDQVAIAPGYLEREWEEGGRRHFRYAMDKPILNFFSVLSGRYQVKRDTWGDVKLEIYHHPMHTYNLDRMMLGMKDALEYCSKHFGPYQHRQMRIIEFPRYARFAQAFPNTVPFSEAIGFIAHVDEKKPNDIDYPYYVTAHEVAHQWWAHQVVGGNVQGATVTSETMSQYAALMVMKHRYGPESMKRFLKYELDRYLLGRVTERKKELPLSRVENQGYIHYSKGSLAMYALQDLVGEDRINRALGRYVEKVRFQGPPYTNSTELLASIREETPPEYQYLLEDLFDTITLYDNRAVSATMKKNGSGGYDVTMKVVAKKYRSDDSGKQTELDFNDWMDVGALDDEGKAVFLEKRRVGKGESEITFSVPVKPARVGLDPLNKLVDRGSDDNVTVPAEQG